MTGRRRWDDSGVLSLSFALVFPAVLFLVIGVAQVALLWYSDSVALTAAREGVDAGRGYQSNDQAAQQRATDFLALCQGLLDKPEVKVEHPDPNTIRVTVRFEPLFLPPGVSGLWITQSATAPIERYVAP
ncbi:TadE/TadG family type IV pilus assembly protein [Kitasatospora sp. NPDC052896]|uniref:TadE/TadG family type IV pilus assembly protein n=1 Tax=Kitasatospora sp. NPDC052896 TaxID=3364061 RepID=UPI0037C4F1BC